MAAELKRSASDCDVTPSQWAVVVPTENPSFLCRVEGFRRLSTSNLHPRITSDGMCGRCRVVEFPFGDPRGDETRMFDSDAITSFAAKVCSRPTIVLMRGPSGSGKSTFAAAVAASVGPSGVVLSTDEFYRALDGSYRFRGALISTAHAWNRWRARYFASRRRSPILIDNTNLAPFEMVPYVRLADEFGYKVVIKEPPTTWKRDPEMCALMSRHQVPQSKTEKMVKKFLPLDIDKLRGLMAANRAERPRNSRAVQFVAGKENVPKTSSFQKNDGIRRSVSTPSAAALVKPESIRPQRFATGYHRSPTTTSLELVQPSRSVAPEWKLVGKRGAARPAVVATPIPTPTSGRGSAAPGAHVDGVGGPTDFSPADDDELARRVDEAVDLLSRLTAEARDGARASLSASSDRSWSGGSCQTDDWNCPDDGVAASTSNWDEVAVDVAPVVSVADDCGRRRTARTRCRHPE